MPKKEDRSFIDHLDNDELRNCLEDTLDEVEYLEGRFSNFSVTILLVVFFILGFIAGGYLL